MKHKIPVFSIRIPEYNVRREPDSEMIGKKIDDLIKRNFMGRRLAIRGLGSQEHKGKSAEELIRIIKKIGSDRYDLNRKGDRYENVGNKKIDFFAIDRVVRKGTKMLKYLIYPFYKYPPQFGRVPIKIDIIILYDLKKLKRVIHRYKGRKDIKRDGFLFREQDNKSGAIVGIIHVK